MTTQLPATRAVPEPAADPAAVRAVPAAAEPPLDAIAVVGLACRVPGADSADAFWANLLAGVDSVTDGPGGARGELGGADLFDAPFFGFSPLEAQRTDPQHRLFLECVHTALDDAGHGDPARRPVTGLFAGSSASTHLLDLLASPRHTADLDESELVIACDKDYLATRVAHRLDLRGPALVVQTACSTSLVAVHLAAQALLAGECDLAVAGGVAVRGRPAGATAGGRGTGRDGMVSPDGRCRAFDADASGMVPGDGVGAVVLRRLDDALAAGDRVLAVLRGTAVNNDGTAKAGYTAPSVSGQVRVIRAAHAAGGTDPAEVGYVEAHGTGTRLGDPVEVAALAEALGPGAPCWLGSVKTNIGHLDAAAGVISLIKAVRAVSTGTIPPTLHFRAPNPELGLAGSRFRVVTEPTALRGPVAVSSFGIGGTNAHAVLEAAPAPAPADAHRPWQVVPVSARTPAALAAAVEATAAALAGRTGADLADAAHTLQVGRRPFEHRVAVAARTGDEAAAALAAARPGVVGRPGVALLFSGQGAQHPGMAAGLRATEPVFRAEFDACLAVAADLGTDLRPALADAGLLRRTEFAQPALFAVEHALAVLWASWGVVPTAVLGHSVGELAAAVAAGVLDRDDALGLAVVRGRAMAACPPGAMLAVAAAVDPAQLPPGVEVAAVNAATQTTVAGPRAAVTAYAEECAARGVRTRLLHTSHAFHTAAMEPAVAEVSAHASGIVHRIPRIPFHSTLTGGPVSTVDDAYWGSQLRCPVRFADALAGVTAPVLVEVGPGRGLVELAGPRAVPSLPTATGTDDPAGTMAAAAAHLWRAGVPVRWSGLHSGQRRRRVSLPGYAFERTSHRLDTPATPAAPVATPAPLPAPAAPPTGTAAAVAAVWERFLGVPTVGQDESFFALGGHSLLGLRVLDELAELTGVRLPLAALYDHPTAAELAAALDSAEQADPADADPAQAGPILPVPHDGAPLSPTQERFWLRQRATPGDTAGTVATAVRLVGDLDTGALDRACAALAARHAVLRARFADTADGPRQVLLPGRGLPLRRTRCADLAELAEVAAAESARPFDLTAEAPARAVLVELADGTHALLLTLHHIATDATSNAVLLTQLADGYAAEVRGEPADTTAGTQYADYAAWLRARPEAERTAAAEHWRTALAGLGGGVELPTDRPAGRAISSARLHRTITGLSAVDGFRERTGAPAFATLLAAFQVLLSRHGAGERFVVGTPTTGRERPELAEVVGPLFTTVPLVADLAGAPTFTELVDRARSTAATAFRNATVPAEPFLASGYDVLFAVQDAPAPRVTLPRLQVEPLELGEGTAQCALTVSAVRDGDALRLLVDYDAARFDRETVDALLDRYARLLTTLPASPDTPVTGAPLLSVPEQRAALDLLTDHADLPWTDATVHGLVAAQARRAPDAPALVCGPTALTYGQLWDVVTTRAAELTARGVGRGDVVAVCHPRSAELVVDLLAVLAAGAAFLPLDPAHPVERRRRMLDDSRAAALLGGTDLGPHRGTPGGAGGHAGPDDLAYLMYTSGSTGEPKGVAVPHAGVCADLAWRRALTGLGPGDRLLHTVSFAFDPAVWQLFGPLVTGAAVVVAEPDEAADPAAVLALLAGQAITVADFVPVQLGRVLDAETGQLAGLRHVFCGGEKLATDLVERFHARTTAELHNQYGPTEATIDTTSYRLRRGHPEHEVPIGRPVAGKKVLVLDQAGALVPPGVVGELWIGGTGLAHGYAGRAGQTAARFRPDPFGAPGARVYRSGDLARYRRDGVLEFAGRVDSQVKVNGVRVEPAEVERALRTHPDVAEAAVVARPVGGRTALVGYVTPRAGTAAGLDTAAVRRAAAAALPTAFVPAHVLALDALPLGHTGKLDAKALPEPTEQGTGRPPAPGTETALADLWAAALGRDAVPADADFFRLGGDSLVAVRLVRTIRARFGVDLALADFFAAPTVADLAAAVTAAAPASGPALLRRGSADAPLSWSQRPVAAAVAAGATGIDVELTVSARVSGPVDPDALAEALTAVVARHEALRVAVDGDRQHPVPAYPVLGRTGPLDPAAGRMLAAELHPTDDGHRIALRAHRLAVDGLSAGILAADLAALYRARLAGDPDPLPPLELHHPDYATWERARITDADAADAARQWVEEFGAHPTTRSTGPLSAATHLLDARATARFAEVAREHGVSARTLLLAVLTDAVAATTGPLPVAVPVGAAARAGLDGVVGRFVDLAVLRPLPATAPFAAHVAAVADEGRAALRRRTRLPYTALAALAPAPLMADLADPAPPLGPGLTAEPPAQRWTDFGLALHAHHIDDRLELVMPYPQDSTGAPALAAALFARLAELTGQVRR
ncbi:hybrid non-ribosomal peptide synthetase/type I polyketide synthase [Actinokineospora bangkokensis]|uniref:Non-ribosomal peptide synthetase n=1 Tax=Actinokineospora bangkokensis TaxID=1193682 RepID=A0A1Q9LIS2_9PSEU|nr:hybrid non-ribosomal peptide synthetase/type I polyketide synthase [Actinokineospora bangkokensis]OLR91900.1 hypothetical protein BJP25_24015 [Actinokineospora bangkokensis]